MSQTIGILGTGDMGSAVGACLIGAGYRVVTALDGRTAPSRELAEQAGLEDLGTLEAVLAEANLFLSILPPARAFDFAREAARYARDLGRGLVYADCNAVSPATVEAIAALFAGSRVRFVDVGIVGPAPRAPASGATRFFVSGPDRESLLDVRMPGVDRVDMGEAIGRASAIKICYAAMNKGVDALYANILLGARRLGVDGALLAEFAKSQGEALARMQKRIPFLAATAERYTGEMAEIAATLDAAGVSGDFHRGAGWLYALLARSSLAAETRATMPSERSLDDALNAYGAALDT